MGIFASGYPNVEGISDTSLIGQLVSAAAFIALGFIPGYVIAWMLKKAGLLRIPPQAEESGLDIAHIPSLPYPEGIPVTAREPFIGQPPVAPSETVPAAPER